VATYTPISLIPPKTMGNGSANVATWQYQATGTFGAVCRTHSYCGQAGTTGSVTVQIGVTGTTAVADQNILDASVITANVTLLNNGWWQVQTNSFFEGYASLGTTTGGAFGVTAN
jgi:hypothetical protein